VTGILTLTPKQCKRARALLKWNPQDLASRTRIPVKHIEKFERNQVKLTKPENKELFDTFSKKNLVFDSDGTVEFQRSTAYEEEAQGAYTQVEDATTTDATSFGHKPPTADTEAEKLAREHAERKRLAEEAGKKPL